MSGGPPAVPQRKYVNIVDETLESILEMITTPVPEQTPEQIESARTTSNAIRMTVRTIVSFMFPLDTVEQIPAFGAIVGVFFDLVKVGLLVSAGNSVTILPQLIGLIPLPLAGTVGMAIGWFISIGFLIAYACISFSRKEFSDTMRSILMMVPVVGSVLGNSFQSVVGTGTKVANRYEQLKMQVSSLWTGVTNAARIAQEQTTLLANKTVAMTNVANAVSQAANVAQTIVANAAALPAQPPPPPPPPPTIRPKAEFAPVQSRLVKQGGKRFTRRKHIKPKWRTAAAARMSRRR
jgi:hypothetical protein